MEFHFDRLPPSGEYPLTPELSNPEAGCNGGSGGQRDVGHDAFICHSSDDAPLAAAICGQLETAAVKCWIAPRDPLPGKPYGRQLVDAIESAKIILLIFSAKANASEHVLRELELASSRGKIVLPCRIEDIAPSGGLEYYIRALHWFDAVSEPFERWMPKLVKLVQQMLSPDWPASIAGESKSQPAAFPNHNLPLLVTSFVGREREIAEIKSLQERSPLVTIVGSGGVGKTSAAIRVGYDILGEARGLEVRLVELGPLTDASLIAETIASVAGVSLGGAAGDPNIILAGVLRQRRVLLLLDNCEHLIEAVAALAAILMRECPNVAILATSRQGLGISGEVVYRIPPLAESEAILLFVERASAVNNRFTTTPESAQVVAEICRQLDGIPLAIELAAARMNALTPQQLRDRLNERFRFLSGTARDRSARQRTLEATIDWSYDLLNPREQTFFRRLGIFIDGFTLEAAETVCIDGDAGLDDVFELTTSLVDKSLVAADLTSDAPRYRLLESMRAYARKKLEASAERDELSDRHLAYMSELFAEARAATEAQPQGSTLVSLSCELKDARAAMDWALERGALETAVDIFVATRLWDYLGLYREALNRGRLYLELLGEKDPLRSARLWESIALWSDRTGNFATACDAAERATDLARKAGDAETLADSLMRLAEVIPQSQRFAEAHDALDEAERIAPGSRRRQLQILHARGRLASIEGDLETAARCFEQVRDIYLAIGAERAVLIATANLAEVEHERGNTPKAIAISREALPQAQRLPDGGQISAALLRNIAGYLLAVDDTAGAIEAATKALAFSAEHDPEGALAAVALEHIALAIALDGHLSRAATLEGYADQTLHGHGFEREPTERKTHQRLRRLLREGLIDGELDALLARGAGLSARSAIAEAAGIRPGV